MGRERRNGGQFAPTRIDEAAGGAVISLENGELRLVLIATPYEGRVRWSLPKGHFHEGETREQTALREVREETGLEPEILDVLGSVDYWFTDKKYRYHKFVHFFLMRAVGGDLADHDDEVVEARVFGWDDALEHMAYPSERRIVSGARERALALLAAEPEAAAGQG